MKLPKLPPIAPEQVVNFSSGKFWGVRDPERFQALMEEAKSLVSPGYYLGDNLFTWGRNNSPFDDTPFREAWAANIRSPADESIAWRRYLLACAAYHCVQLEGDFVECGVDAGSGVKTVIDYLGGPEFPRTFWAYDAFDDVPGSGQLDVFLSAIRQRFADYPQVRLVAGTLPDSFEQGMPERIAYLHIDLNDAASELAVLERLFERVVAGGIVMLDDYEWAGDYRVQKQAEDPWFDARGYRVFPLPTGQGMLIKR